MTMLSIILTVIAAASLLLTRVVLFPMHQPTSVLMWVIKVVTDALSPILLCGSVMVIGVSGMVNSVPAILIGCVASAFYLLYIVGATRPALASEGFDSVFGKEWENRITSSQKQRMLRARYVFLFPKSPEANLNQNISFYTVPESNRPLLCDVWQPSDSINRSGLALIYLHGSAWTHLDKDFGTRSFFRHLANQGHVIMDVAYRLYPETDFKGMIYDTKHAVAWLKANAATYGVDPDRIVLCGGSAGAHLALMAAYSGNDPQLTPPDLLNFDLNIKAVVSLYGQSDLTAMYYHTCQHLTKESALGQKKTKSAFGLWMQKKMGADFHRLGFDKAVEPGRVSPMLGGSPEEKPDLYALFSPISHVNSHCPPTLLIHGEHDILAPPAAIRKIYTSLVSSGVKVILHTIPKTDHAFDLVLPKISPSAHNAIYDVERFLSMMASDNRL